MIVLLDLEWIDSGRKYLTQLSAARVDEQWNEVETINRLVRPMPGCLRDRNHMALGGYMLEAFTNGVSVNDCMTDFAEWLIPDDTILVWARSNMRFMAELWTWLIGDTMPKMISAASKVRALCANRTDRDFGQPYELLADFGEHAPEPEHRASNDVEVMRRLFSHVGLSLKHFEKTPPMPPPPPRYTQRERNQKLIDKSQYNYVFLKRDALIAEYKAAGRRTEIQQALKELHWNAREATIPEDLCFVYGQYLEDYLFDVEICQQFARRSREKMAEILLERTGLTAQDAFHTIHNYIDTDEMILRKGAIAAHKGEKVLIPINMRDGSVLAVGKGNPEWNFSAPHGAGRIMSRTAAKEALDLEEYRREMSGVYTTSVNEATLDEAPMAYKSLSDIIDVIRESVDVIEVLKPIYNFKAN